MATRGPKRKLVLFTDDNVVTFPAPKSGTPLIYRDEALPGLILRVSKTGVRSYATETRNPQGGKSNEPLGFAPTDDLATIRIAAGAMLTKLNSEGLKEAARTGGKTMEAVLASYIADKKIPPENSGKYKQTLRTYGWPFWNKPVKSITRTAVQAHRTKVRDGDFPTWPGSTAKGGPGMANDFTEYGSMVMTWVLGKKEPNPFKDHEAYQTQDPKGRYVIRAKDWGGIAQITKRWHQDDQDLFWTHIMLGARPMGTSRMRWDRVLWDKGAYKLTKDRKECQGWKPAQSPGWEYPVDTWTLDLLRERQKFADPDSPYIWPSPQRRHEGSGISTSPLDRMFRELREQLGLPANFTPYSSKYTRASYSDAMFGKGFITAAMCDHVIDKGTSQTRKYVFIDSDEAESFGYSQIKRYVERYSEIIRELCGWLPVSDEVVTKLLTPLKARP